MQPTWHDPSTTAEGELLTLVKDLEHHVLDEVLLNPILISAKIPIRQIHLEVSSVLKECQEQKPREKAVEKRDNHTLLIPVWLKWRAGVKSIRIRKLKITQERRGQEAIVNTPSPAHHAPAPAQYRTLAPKAMGQV